MAHIPGFEWLEDPAGNDVRNARQGNFMSPSGVADCPTPGGAPQLPPRGPSADSIGVTRLIFPPRIEKLYVSQDFNTQRNSLILPAGVGSTVVLPGFQVPQGMIGWLQQTYLYILTPTALTTATWTVRINQAPVSGFDNIINPPGIANFIIIPTDDMRIRLPNSCVVDVIITNNSAAGPWTVGAGLSGWTHPEVAERRAFGEVNNI